MNPVTLLQIAGGTIGFIVAVAFVVAFLRTNVSKATIDLYRQDNDALRARISTLEDEERVKDKQIATLVTKVAALEQSREELLAVVTQKHAIARLERAVAWIVQKEGFNYDQGA